MACWPWDSISQRRRLRSARKQLAPRLRRARLASCLCSTQFAFENSGELRGRASDCDLNRVGVGSGNRGFTSLKACLYRAAFVIWSGATAVLIGQVNLHSRDVTREMLEAMRSQFLDDLLQFRAAFDVIVGCDFNLHALNVAKPEAAADDSS